MRELENLIHREFLLAESGRLRIRLPAPRACSVESPEPPAARLVNLGYSQAKALSAPGHF